MEATNYRIGKLGALLKVGKARINGKTCSGNVWPEGEHYWIVDDLVDFETYHVPVDSRPSWKRYAPKE